MYIGTSTGRGSFESSAMDHAKTGINTAPRENQDCKCQGKIGKEIPQRVRFSGVHHSSTLDQSKREDEFSTRHFHEQEIEEKCDGEVQGTEHPQMAKTDRSNSK